MSVVALKEHLKRVLPKAKLRGKQIDFTCYEVKIVIGKFTLHKIEAHSQTQAIEALQEWLNKLVEAMEE